MAGTYINLPVSGGGGGGSTYWQDAVANFASLPTGTYDGEVRMTLDSRQLYYWDAGGSSWELVPTGAIDPADVSDTNSLDLTVTLGVLTGDVKLSSNAADANFSQVALNIESTGVNGIRAQIANSVVRGLLSSGDAYIGYNSSTGAITISTSAVRGLFSSTTDDITYNSTTGAFTFNPGNVSHSELANLLADDHTQYALLAGRVGGQQLTGGTGSGDKLTLRSTSNATKGTVEIQDVIQLPLRTTAQISAIASPADGMLVHDTDVNRTKVYIAGTTNAWVTLQGWGNP